MRPRLAGAISEGSGPINEDGWGLAGSPDDVRAAWVLDGVTGINARSYVSGTTDAHWLVGQADHHLRHLAAAGDQPLRDICAALVDRLSKEFAALAARSPLPGDYDPPAACLLIVKRYRDGWHALRLGDSCLLSDMDDPDGSLFRLVPGPGLDRELAREAELHRQKGISETPELLKTFRTRLLASRAKRNTADGYGILECSRACLDFAEVCELPSARRILLCTDGFYRAVDHYGLCSDHELLHRGASEDGLKDLMADIRRVERDDADCRRFPRLKPADDATAVALRVAHTSY
jgi:hypothetical protein